MHKYFFITLLALAAFLYPSCKNKNVSVSPAPTKRDIKLIVGNYKWARQIKLWIGSWDSTYSISDTTFQVFYVNDTTVSVLKYELKLMEVDSLYKLRTGEQNSNYGASLYYNPKNEIAYFSYHTGGLGGGTHYYFEGTKMK